MVEDTREAFASDVVLLDVAARSGEMWNHLRLKPCDLLVVDRSFLGRDLAYEFQEIQHLPESPEVIVLVRVDDPAQRAELLDAGALACLATDLERPTLYRTVRALIRRTQKRAETEFIADDAALDCQLSDFASKSPPMQSFLATVRKVVRGGSSLLILGETGVGKEHLARAIHREGPRSENPFVAVNCAALPEPLLESELFGHVAGSFTGAHKTKRGYFELANGGSVFLDEIGELPLHLQVKLLRVLQERRVQPVGSEREIRVDIRVMAATNRDLKAEMVAQRFRSDLYYRLGVVTLTVPPLRERKEDIPDLVRNHIEHFSKALGQHVFGIRSEAMDCLLGYSWPGNVRELINVIERAVLLSDGEELGLEDLPDDVLSAGGRTLEDEGPQQVAGFDELIRQPLQQAREALVERFERRYLHELLTQTGGKVGEAAARAAITPRSLYSKMRRFGLQKEAYKPPRRQPR